MRKIVSFFSLFTSVSTLLCCALPALFVALGFGAAVAGVVGNVPQLIWLSERKGYLFAIGGFLLFAGGLAQWKARTLACPVDSNQANACQTFKDWSTRIYIASLVLYSIGLFAAYGAPRLLGS